MITVTFCGHSDYKESAEDKKKILTVLTEKIGDQNADLLIGGYGAFDAFARECGRKYQRTHPNTRLVFVTPYVSPSDKKIYSYDRKKNYDAIVYPPLEHVPPHFAILKRNEWMVKQADLLIAYVRHGWGGARKTLDLAEKAHKEIFNLAE